MTDFIDRALATSHPFANGRYDHKNANEHFILGHESYREWLEDLPSADVWPVVRGEWIDDGCITRCKYCGEEKEFPHWRFCPDCGSYNGADMRGGDAE